MATATAAVVSLRAKGRGQAGGTEAPASPPSLLALLNHASAARGEVERLRAGLEKFGAESWAGRRRAEESYRRVLSSLFHLMDQIEVFLDRGQDSRSLDWYGQSIRLLFDGEEIERMVAERGEPFNGLRHKHAGERPDGLPHGAVLEVVRAGYVRKRDGEEEVFRPAEVIVSGGPDGELDPIWVRPLSDAGRSESGISQG